METLDDNEKKYLNGATYEKNQEEISDIDELTVMYFFKCCGCPALLFFFIQIFFLWCPLSPILVFCCMPYKRKIRIDKKNKLFIIYNVGAIPCCKLSPKPYNLDNIKKIRIYVYSTPDPKVGFNKLYFVNCEIYSLKDEKEELFRDIKYDKEAFDGYILFFKKYFETEVENIDVAKDKSEYNINNQTNALNLNDDYPSGI